VSRHAAKTEAHVESDQHFGNWKFSSYERRDMANSQLVSSLTIDGIQTPRGRLQVVGLYGCAGMGGAPPSPKAVASAVAWSVSPESAAEFDAPLFTTAFDSAHADEDTLDTAGAGGNQKSGESDHRFRAYLAAVRQGAHLDHASELELFEQLQKGQVQLQSSARSALIQANLWLVPIIVRRFYTHGSSFEDLVAEGNLGLYRALDRFEPARGLRFSTYAKWWVTHVVTAAMSANAYAVNVPRRVGRQLARQRRLVAAGGGNAGDTGPARTSTTKYDEALPTLLAPLTESIHADWDAHSADDEQNNACAPDVMLARKQCVSLLCKAVHELPTRERLVIEARYGLAGRAERTLQDLGRELGMSAEGVRKVQLAGMQRLRHKLAAGWA
jgi:RNA polymerase sigma factor (sigma-70 family)